MTLSPLGGGSQPRTWMTLYGDYMAVVPQGKQGFVEHIAAKERVSTRTMVERLLENGIARKRASNITPSRL